MFPHGAQYWWQTQIKRTDENQCKMISLGELREVSWFLQPYWFSFPSVKWCVTFPKRQRSQKIQHDIPRWRIIAGYNFQAEMRCVEISLTNINASRWFHRCYKYYVCKHMCARMFFVFVKYINWNLVWFDRCRVLWCLNVRFYSFSSRLYQKHRSQCNNNIDKVIWIINVDKKITVVCQ